MKRLLTMLAFLPISLFAQRKLPINCTEIKTKLMQIQKSFKSLEKWKTQDISEDYESKYSTNFSFCGARAVIEIFGDNEEELNLVIAFKDYKATDTEHKAFIQKLRKAINEIFNTHVEEFDKSEDPDFGTSYYYQWTYYGDNPKGNIKLQYPGIDDVLLTLTFTWKKE